MKRIVFKILFLIGKHPARRVSISRRLKMMAAHRFLNPARRKSVVGWRKEGVLIDFFDVGIVHTTMLGDPAWLDVTAWCRWMPFPGGQKELVGVRIHCKQVSYRWK